MALLNGGILFYLILYTHLQRSVRTAAALATVERQRWKRRKKKETEMTL